MSKDKKNDEEVRVFQIPELKQIAVVLRLVGDSPLLLNNKMSIAWRIAGEYFGTGKTGKIKPEQLTVEEQYVNAFYALPSSPSKPPAKDGLYGVPASGIKKCLVSGIRPAGFTDNTVVGQISKGFRVLDDEGGLCLIRHNGFVKDARPVNIGSGQKTMPQIRYRPLFSQWELHVRVLLNARILSEEQIANLAMYAGQYIGLCELRAEKKQGECGGFIIGSWKDMPNWASDKRWGVVNDVDAGFRFSKKGRK